jgi:hypothetical protein
MMDANAGAASVLAIVACRNRLVRALAYGSSVSSSRTATPASSHPPRGDAHGLRPLTVWSTQARSTPGGAGPAADRLRARDPRPVPGVWPQSAGLRAARSRSPGRSRAASPRCSTPPTQTAWRCAAAATATRRRRSSSAASIAARPTTRSTRCRRHSAARPRPGRARRCTSRAWPSTSRATAAAQCRTAPSAGTGSSPTPATTASRPAERVLALVDDGPVSRFAASRATVVRLRRRT